MVSVFPVFSFHVSVLCFHAVQYTCVFANFVVLDNDVQCRTCIMLCVSVRPRQSSPVHASFGRSADKKRKWAAQGTMGQRRSWDTLDGA